MGCPCQGNSNVWTPPVEGQAANDAQPANGERRVERRGPTIWTDAAGAQPPARQKA